MTGVFDKKPARVLNSFKSAGGKKNYRTRHRQALEACVRACVFQIRWRRDRGVAATAYTRPTVVQRHIANEFAFSGDDEEVATAFHFRLVNAR